MLITIERTLELLHHKPLSWLLYVRGSSFPLEDMSCYLRHLDEVLGRAGIEVTKENRRQIDEAVHKMAGVEGRDCPRAWKEVKRMLAEDEEGFIRKLRGSLG